MDDNMVWCALIFALAYISRNMLPSYYEITSVRRHSLDNMRDDILRLETSVDAINNAVDDNEQELMGALKKIEDMQSDIAGHLTRIDDLEENARGYRVMIEVLQREASKAKLSEGAMNQLEYLRDLEMRRVVP